MAELTRYPVRIAVQIQPQHFFSVYDSGDSGHYECWTTLAAWAEATSRVEIGGAGHV